MGEPSKYREHGDAPYLHVNEAELVHSGSELTADTWLIRFPSSVIRRALGKSTWDAEESDIDSALLDETFNKSSQMDGGIVTLRR